MSDMLLVIILKSPTEYGICVIHENDYSNQNKSYMTLHHLGADLTYLIQDAALFIYIKAGNNSTLI